MCYIHIWYIYVFFYGLLKKYINTLNGIIIILKDVYSYTFYNVYVLCFFG